MLREDFLRWASRFPDALLLVSTEGQILACNGVLVELLGLPEAKIAESTLYEWAPANPTAVRAALRLWSASGRMIYAPAEFFAAGIGALRLEGGLLSPASGTSSPVLVVRLKRQQEAVQRFLGLNRKVEELHNEIRARKLSEAEIRKQREWLHVTLSSIGDAVIATDVRGNIEFLNPVAEALTGWTSKDAFGQPMARIFDIFNEETKLPAENPVARVLREGVIVGLANHTVLRAKDGTERPIEDSAAPIRNAEGALIGVVLVFHDVSAEYEDRREVERARDEALAASRAKDQFLAALSHELRTPLNPVLLIASEGAADPALPEAVRRDFEVIAKNSLLEARLIDDLLDLTRITSGKMSLDLQEVDAHAVLQDALRTITADHEAKPLALEVDFGAPSSLVHGDAVRLQQVFWNLLKNAIKFTPPQGRVSIRTRAVPAGLFELTITDTGLGMTAAELGRAFEAFAQGDHATSNGSHRFGGLGLGLAISRRLVELHSGSIRAESAGRDRGATFIVTLPVLAGSRSAAPARREARIPESTTTMGAGRRLLLIEDHEPTRSSLERLLSRRGFVVIACETAMDARAAAAAHSFDLVVSDIGLPDGDGYELMHELQLRYQLRGVALTGYGTEKDVAKSLKAGFVTHLTKPVSVGTLETALRLLDPGVE